MLGSCWTLKQSFISIKPNSTKIIEYYSKDVHKPCCNWALRICLFLLKALSGNKG